MKVDPLDEEIFHSALTNTIVTRSMFFLGQMLRLVLVRLMLFFPTLEMVVTS
jgi:hypothetical protein